MATVYLARDVKHDRDVALKVLRPELVAVLGAERFLREIRISAHLDHPRILTLIDSGQNHRFIWYVMPYVRGESLRARLTREKQLSIEEAIRIATQVASALDYAHRHGVIHRDVKPENILLHEGEAVVADFGIALAVREAGGDRLTEAGLSLGTPGYMSPEQATGGQVDERSDVYALGAVAYEMVAGEPPHTGPTAQTIVARLLAEEPTPLHVLRRTISASVEAAVEKALAKVPADRFPSVAEFAKALEDGRAPRPIPQRARVGQLAALLSVLGVGLLLIWSLWSRPSQIVPTRASLIAVTSTGAARAPAISPDGSTLAYFASSCSAGPGTCPWDLVWQDIGGGPPLHLLPGVASPSAAWPQIRWLDQTRLVFVDPDLEQTILVSRTGGVRRVLRGVLLGLGTGDTITTTNSYTDPQTVYTIAAGSGLVTDSLRFTRGFVSRVEVSPNGRWLAMLARPTAFGWTSAALLITDRRWHVVDTVARDPASFGNLQWSPASDAVYYFRPGGREAEFELVRQHINPATGHRRRAADVLLDRIGRISFEGSAPSFDVSRDGRTLVLEELRGKSYAYHTLMLTSDGLIERPARLFRSSTVSSAFGLALDGRHVVLAVPERAGEGAAFRFQVSPVDSDAPVTVGPAFPSETQWWIGHDGRKVLLAQAVHEKTRWAAMDLTSGQLTRWHEITPAPGSLTDMAGGVLLLSPDGLVLSHFDSLDQEHRIVNWAPTGVKGIDITMAPDGRSVAINGFNEQERTLTLHVLSLSTGSIMGPWRESYTENIWWSNPIWVGDQPAMPTFNYHAHGPRLLTPGPAKRFAVRVALPPEYAEFAVSRDGRRAFTVLKTTRSDISMLRLGGQP